MGDWKLLPQLTACLMDGGLEQDHRDMLEDCLKSITSAAATGDDASGITATTEGPPEEGSVIIKEQEQENGFKGILNLITEALQEPILNRQFQKLLVGTTRAFANFNKDQRRRQQQVGDSAENNNNCHTTKSMLVFDEPVWLESTEPVNQEFHHIIKEETASFRPDNNDIKFLAEEEDDYVDALSSVEEAGSSESLYFSDFSEPIITTPFEYIFMSHRSRGKFIRMADDREVLREIWEGQLPLQFVLSSEEVHTLNVPDPFYLMVPRLLYFPLVTDKVRKHFIQYINPESANKEMWLDYNGQPIKWNYPIGVWFDVFCIDSVLPWTVTVHFENYPEGEILHCSSKDAIRSQFMSALKEADALKHKGQVINNMQEKDHHQLWLGFQNDKFDQFWSVNKKLMESVAGEGFRNIPIKCYIEEKPVQRLVKPIDETTGSWTTLQDALLEFLSLVDCNGVRVITHGIEPSLQTPLQWMSEHLSYPDNFLHLTILNTTPSSTSK